MDYYIYNGELYHDGRKGMKWYQNIFTKDKTGSKRRKTSRANQDEDNRSETRSKSYRDMTDDELRRETDRFNLEANYLSAKSRANPPYNQQQKADSFAKKFLNDAVKPALINAGRNQIEKIMNAQISKLTKGKVDPDSLEYLKDMAEKLNYKSKISTAKKVIAINEDWEEDRAKTKAEQAKAKAQKEVDDYNGHLNDQKTTDGPTPYSKSGYSVYDRFTRTRESSNLPAVINRPRDYSDFGNESARPSSSSNNHRIIDAVGEVVQEHGLMRVNSDSYNKAADRGRSYTNQFLLTDGYVTVDDDWNPIDN